MTVDVSRFTTVEEARNYLENVRRLDRKDLYPDAFRRLCELEGKDHSDPLVVDFWRAIAAAEEVLREQRGKTVRLNRTRQKIERVGEHKTVEDLALKKNASDGFAILTDAGLADLTAEYLVLVYRDRFSEKAVEAARTRLVGIGVTLPDELAK